MRNIRRMLTDTRTLWILFLGTFLMVFAFAIVVRKFDLVLLDGLSDRKSIQSTLAAMTPTQKYVHAWVTGTLDVLFPLVYGSFFIGMALRFFERAGPLLALPGLAVIPVDIIEGIVQILMLNGHESIMSAKAILTPLKLILFYAGLAVAVTGLGVGLWRRMFRRQS